MSDMTKNDGTIDGGDVLFDPVAFNAGKDLGERRKLPRASYEVAATLAQGGVEGQEFVLYTRDINSGGSGFVSPTDISDIEAATIQLAAPDGTVRKVRCHVKRARQIGEGWVEGYVEFDEPTAVFSTKRINAGHAKLRQAVFAGA